MHLCHPIWKEFKRKLRENKWFKHVDIKMHLKYPNSRTGNHIGAFLIKSQKLVLVEKKNIMKIFTILKLKSWIVTKLKYISLLLNCLVTFAIDTSA